MPSPGLHDEADAEPVFRLYPARISFLHIVALRSDGSGPLSEFAERLRARPDASPWPEKQKGQRELTHWPF
jgi:hypothetical protein